MNLLKLIARLALAQVTCMQSRTPNGMRDTKKIDRKITIQAFPCLFSSETGYYPPL